MHILIKSSTVAGHKVSTKQDILMRFEKNRIKTDKNSMICQKTPDPWKNALNLLGTPVEVVSKGAENPINQ